MFDFNWSEIALVVIVALIFIGPKDMPVAIRALGRGVRTVRKMASEFQTHVDDMVREADLGEARDHLRDLKRFDVRGQFMRAIDGDGTMRKGLGNAESGRRDPAPVMQPPLMADGAPHVPIAPEPPYAMSPAGGPAYASADHAGPDHAGAGVPAEAYGPSILPPAIARRVRDDRIRRHAPKIVPPPRAIHAQRRVAIDAPDV